MSKACTHQVCDEYPPDPSHDAWPNFPVLVRHAPGTISNHHNDGPIKIHNIDPAMSEILIKNKYFEGKAYMVIKGLTDSPTHCFSGRQRKSEIVLQGKFLKPLSFATVFTGQAFDFPFTTPPPSSLVSILMPIMATLQPSVRAKLDGNRPYMLSPLMSTVNTISVNIPGSEPCISALRDLREDLTILNSGVFKGMSSASRKRYFTSRENLLAFNFNPDLIYTFDIFQLYVNLSTFKVEYGLLSFDLIRLLGKRGFQFMAVVWDPNQHDNFGDSSDQDCSDEGEGEGFDEDEYMQEDDENRYLSDLESTEPCSFHTARDKDSFFTRTEQDERLLSPPQSSHRYSRSTFGPYRLTAGGVLQDTMANVENRAGPTYDSQGYAKIGSLSKKARLRGVWEYIEWIISRPWATRQLRLHKTKQLIYFDGDRWRGEISIVGCCARILDAPQADGNLHSFGIFRTDVDKELLVLAAESDEERDEWVAAINAVISDFHTGASRGGRARASVGKKRKSSGKRRKSENLSALHAGGAASSAPKSFPDRGLSGGRSVGPNGPAAKGRSGAASVAARRLEAVREPGAEPATEPSDGPAEALETAAEPVCSNGSQMEIGIGTSVAGAGQERQEEEERKDERALSSVNSPADVQAGEETRKASGGSKLASKWKYVFNIEVWHDRCYQAKPN